MGSGTGKKVNGALDRITLIEEQLEGIVQIFETMVQKNFTTIGKRLEAIEEVVDALVGCVGVDGVTTMLEGNRRRAADARAAAAKAKLDEAIAAGKVVPAEVVSEKSVIAGTERDKQGEVRGPERQQFSISSMKEEFKGLAMGAPVGTVLELPEHATFTITEIYDTVPDVEPSPASA